MSQSDYLRRKRVSYILRNDAASDPSVLDSGKLLSYKQYQLENEIVSTNQPNHNILPVGKQDILGMERNISECPTFIVCGDTSSRPNRVAHTGRMCSDVPLNWHEKNALNNAKQLLCKCEINEPTTEIVAPTTEIVVPPAYH